MNVTLCQNAFPVALEGLKESIIEKYPSGEAVGGIAHVNLIDELRNICEKYGYSSEISDLFAVNNKDKYRPGVTIDKERAKQTEELHYGYCIFRRLFMNVDLKIPSVEGASMRMVLSYSQRGITVAFGPEVYACRNLSILHAKDVFSSYKIDRFSAQERTFRDIKVFLTEIENYVANISMANERQISYVREISKVNFTEDFYSHLLYILMNQRCLHDAEDKSIRLNETYSLNSAQINAVHTRAASSFIQAKKDGKVLTGWDGYNLLNLDLKPTNMETPNLIPQSLALSEAFMENVSYFENK